MQISKQVQNVCQCGAGPDMWLLVVREEGLSEKESLGHEPQRGGQGFRWDFPPSSKLLNISEAQSPHLYKPCRIVVKRKCESLGPGPVTEVCCSESVCSPFGDDCCAI